MSNVRAISALVLASSVAMWAETPISGRYVSTSAIVLLLVVAARVALAFLFPRGSRVLLALSVGFGVLVIGAVLTVVEFTQDPKWLYITLAMFWFATLVTVLILRNRRSVTKTTARQIGR